LEPTEKYRWLTLIGLLASISILGCYTIKRGYNSRFAYPDFRREKQTKIEATQDGEIRSQVQRDWGDQT